MKRFWAPRVFFAVFTGFFFSVCRSALNEAAVESSGSHYLPEGQSYTDSSRVFLSKRARVNAMAAGAGEHFETPELGYQTQAHFPTSSYNRYRLGDDDYR